METKRGAKSRTPRLPDASDGPAASFSRHHIFDSELALLLVREWSWGFKSAVQLRKEANAAYNDQVNLLRKLKMNPDHASKSLAAISGLGSDGHYENNINKQLKSLLGIPSFPEPSSECVPLKILKPKGQHKDESTQMVDFPILGPHVYLSWLYEHKPAVFRQQFMGGDASGSYNLYYLYFLSFDKCTLVSFLYRCFFGCFLE